MIREVKKGFTIMELLLAMSILSLLLLAIAMMTMQMTNIIAKGTTFKELNSAGRTINSEFTKTLNSIDGMGSWSGNSGDSYYRTEGGGGAFCTGKVSYLWNTNDSLESGNGRIGYASGSSIIRLVKVRDAARAYCADTNRWHQVPSDTNQTTEILAAGETDLRLYNIQFSSNSNLKDSASGQTVINIGYVLGTPKTSGVQLNSGTMNCTGDTKNNYCAVNKFELTVRTLGRQG